MLPNYPDIKEEVNKYLKERMKRNSMPSPMDKVNKRKIHEGDSNIIIRPDGTEQEKWIINGFMKNQIIFCRSNFCLINKVHLSNFLICISV